MRPARDSARTGPAEFGGRALRKAYARRDVVNGVSLRVRRGAICGLLGPSGSGKSTIFRILSGIERPDEGMVFHGDTNITGLGIDARARLGVGYVQQSPDLFLSLTTRENLVIALEARGAAGRDIDHMLSVIARTFLLEEFLSAPVGTLSGGQRKLVEIGFSMCARPRFLLLDEPFAKLDPINVETICGRLRLLARAGVGILLTDHKARTALALADHVNIIDDGIIVTSGPCSQVAASDILRTVFLGESSTA